MRASPLIFVSAVALTAVPTTTLANHHLMQIEQVIAGVDGDTNQQAVQLRMRSLGQSVMSSGRLRVFDATGANPVLVIDFASNVAIGSAGARVLLLSPGFDAAQGPNADFVMTSTIPPSYLAAGRMTFELDSGTIWWSLCWGGSSYTGPTTGDVTNDPDGNFGPCFPGPLPSVSNQAVRFTGSAGAASSKNAADYALTPAAATFTNNAGASSNVVLLFSDGFE
jgi:hypothetical protein